jgi:ribose 5-phosphate isomerase RpiB
LILKIVVVTESSTVEKNKDVIAALDGFGHEIINIGMKKLENEPSLSYIETSFIGAMMLELGVADFVVGGCGTGQGFFNGIVQFPGVSCGLIQDPTDAWLFAQINGGNSISLALNKGYGWAGDVNLKFVFEKLFSVEFGCGYPEPRREIQKNAREKLKKLSIDVHYPIKEILEKIDITIIKNSLNYPGVIELIENVADSEVKNTLLNRYKNN